MTSLTFSYKNAAVNYQTRVYISQSVSMDIRQRLHDKNFAIIDCEYIQTSARHKCIRSMYILTKDGFTSERREFSACKRYYELEDKYKRAFQYCRRHIHKLPYDPKCSSPHCTQSTTVLYEFIVKHNVKLVLYKGGQIEKELCDEINFPSFNIERLDGIHKADTHDPDVEVHFHYKSLIQGGYVFPIPSPLYT